jgi:hypothetical protein
MVSETGELCYGLVSWVYCSQNRIMVWSHGYIDLSIVLRDGLMDSPTGALCTAVASLPHGLKCGVMHRSRGDT